MSSSETEKQLPLNESLASDPRLLDLLHAQPKEALIELVRLQQAQLESYRKEVELLRKLRQAHPEQESLAIADHLLIIRNVLFGRSSEKRPEPKDIEQEKSKRQNRGKGAQVLLPSLRYPGLSLVEKELAFQKGQEPQCRLCQHALAPMRQTENAERIQVIEKTYYIERQKRAKYRCTHCHGDIQTAPALPRIVSGGAFGDEVAIDVAVAKYADHLPIERYVRQAERCGLVGVNPQTLIEQTHFLADFLEPVYLAIRQEVQQAFCLHADETPWRMLEGDDKSGWQMWGFFTQHSSYLEAHPTRAGKVAGDFLKNCRARYLMSDAYSGYAASTQGTEIKNLYCNAHARRKFVEAELSHGPRVQPLLELYRQIYQAEADLKGIPPDLKQLRREQEIRPLFEALHGQLERLEVLPSLSIGQAKAYFLKYYSQLTRFLEDPRLPIDNNLAERGLRAPVLGRKNFYGNHSKRGARTTQILYSIVESCKLNQVEPSHYLKQTVQAIHRKQSLQTPAQFKILMP